MNIIQKTKTNQNYKRDKISEKKKMLNVKMLEIYVFQWMGLYGVIQLK